MSLSRPKSREGTHKLSQTRTVPCVILRRGGIGDAKARYLYISGPKFMHCLVREIYTRKMAYIIADHCLSLQAIYVHECVLGCRQRGN